MSDDSEADNAPDGAFCRTATEFKPMFTPDEPKEKTFGNDADGLKEAARSLTDAREERRVPKVAEDTPIVDRNYHWDGGKGDAVPENYTLEARQAANDLARVRQQEALSREPDTAAQIDEVRNAWNNPQAQQQQPQPDPQTQLQQQEAQQQVEQPPQQQQPPTQEDQLRKILTEHPEVRRAMEVELQQVEAARQAYQSGTWQAAQVSAASLLANYPELAQVPSEHLKTAIAAVAATNPERAMQINAHLERTQALYNASKQAEAQQQQLQMQNLHAWVSDQDRIFERDVIAKEDPATLQKVKDNLVQIAQESYGISKEQLSHALLTNPILRSSSFQSVFLDAAKYRLAQRESAGKLDRSVPPVQRPGVATDQNVDTGVERALEKFRASPDAKSAAALLVARRAATRR